MDTPEQGLDHSDLDVSPEEIQKLTGLMDESGSFGDLSEANDPPESEAPKEAPKPESQDQPALAEVEIGGKKYQLPAELRNSFAEVEIGGKKYHVPADIKDGFLMQADYTRKTQEVAQQRSTVEQQRAEVQRMALQAQQYVGHYAAVKQIDDEIQAIRSINPQELVNDPLRDLQVRQRATELMQARQNVLGQIEQAKGHMTQQQALQTRQAVEEGRQYLAKAIPDWEKPETQKALVDAAISLGFKPEEANAVMDPRQVLALHRIATLDAKVKEYEAAALAASKQVRSAPPKVVRAQASHDPADQPRQNEGLTRLRKSGSDDDAVAALKALLG